MLRAVMHDPVAARDQELRGDGDGARIGDDALGGLVEAEQDIDRDRPRDQRVGIVGGDARRIVGEEFRLHVGIDEEVAAQLLHQLQPAPRERHVELHLEGGRGEHHGAQLRRVIVRPGRHQHRADALRHDRHVLDFDAVGDRDMVDEALHVAHRRADARREAALSRRAAVAARVPREDHEVAEIQLVGDVRHPPGMLVPAMEEEDGAARLGGKRRPISVEELDAVMRAKRLLEDRASGRLGRWCSLQHGPRLALSPFCE